MERDILVRPTKMTRPVKVDHLQSWSRIFWSDQTEIDHSIWSTNWNFWNFGLNGNKEPLDSSLWRILRFTPRLHTAYLPNYFQLCLLKFCHTLLTNLTNKQAQKQLKTKILVEFKPGWLLTVLCSRIFKIYWVVPENIHTPTMEGIGNLEGMGRSEAQEIPEGRGVGW